VKILLALAWLVATCSSSDGADVAQILETWRARQAETTTLSLQWKNDVRIGGKVFQVEESLVFDEMRRLRTDTYQIGSGGRGDQHPVTSRKSINVFDAAVRTTFFEQGQAEFPSAHIIEGSTINVARFLFIAPVFLAVRPLDPNFTARPLDSMIDSGKRETFQGQNCILLNCGDNTLWVTDDPHALLVRCHNRSSLDLRPLSDMHLSYVREGTNWRLKQWKVIRFGINEQQIVDAREATVTNWTANKPIDEEVFRLTYPPGTFVSNTLLDESFITREGKPSRVIRKGEFTGDNYKQLRDSEPPPVPE
jgi:hypothetical protein